MLDPKKLDMRYIQADLDYVARKLKDGNAYSAELEFDTEGRFCLDYVPSSFDDDGEV